VQLVALGDGEAEILRVAMPGDPKVGRGETVAVEGSRAGVGARRASGMAFRRLAVRSATGRSPSRSGENTAG
jgi:hypothetical protein